MVRIPSHIRQKIARYKKTVQELEQKLGRMPTDNEIADKMRVSVGLRRLRIGKAKRELLEKFDIVEAGAYRNSMNKFNEHGFTSTVEYNRFTQGRITGRV